MPRHRPHAVGTTVLAAVLAVAPTARAGDEEDRAADKALCREARIGTDDEALIAFFRARTPTAGDRERLAALVRQLGSDEFSLREQASAALTDRGPLAVPPLKMALDDPDPEVVRRARACLEEIEHGPGPALPAAAARLLAHRRPAGAAAALLGFAPHAADLFVEDEVCKALAAVGVRDSKVEAVLLAALADKDPARRAAAAYAVGRCGDASGRAAVAALGRDPEPAVRVRAGAGLLAGRDRAGLAILVGLLADAPLDVADRAEEVLLRVAGEQAPRIDLPMTGRADVTRRQAAWEAWRREHGAGADLARLDDAGFVLGYTTVVEPEGGKVWEFDRGGKVRWQITGLGRPHFAQTLPNGRVLLCEHDTGQVTERDLTGKVLWSHAAVNARYVERLPDGSTFVGTVADAFEVTPAGKIAYNVRFGGESHLGVHRRPNGNIVALSIPGALTERDRCGRAVRSLQLGNGHWCSVVALPNDRYLAVELNQGRIVEVDAGGKVVWACKVPGAGHALHRPSGRTLVCCYNGNRLVEVDRGGKIVWEKAADSRVWRASDR